MRGATCSISPNSSGATPHERRFIITGSQTGGLPVLTGAHYTLVRESHPAHNLIAAEGPILPSSESLTHGAVYALDDALRFVMHVHAPALWRHAHTLGLPVTRPDVAYGTPEMSDEVGRLFRETDARRRRLFAMGGHEDGLVSFGTTAEEAGAVLLTYLARALQLG
jgi:ribulose-5-phosphate 4-epimerase/fuculose-1-phosphate aldolase